MGGIYKRVLGRWISQQQDKCNKSTLGSEKQQVWENFIKEYPELVTKYDKWYHTLQQVKDWIKENKRTPSQVGKESLEKQLGNWISHQTTNYKKRTGAMKDPKKRRAWENYVEEYSDYILDPDKQWYDMLHKLQNFIDENKKRPSTHSKDLAKKSLGIWTCNQTIKYKADVMENEMRQNWKEFIEKYSEIMMNFDEKWSYMLQKLKKFIDENNKRPTKHDENSLGNWTNDQIKNYKKCTGVLKKPEKRKRWAEFVTSYPHLFDTSYLDTPKPKIKTKKSITTIQPNPKSNSNTKSKLKPNNSELSELHKQYKTLHSQNLHTLFQDTPELWHDYHNISEKNEEQFLEQEEIPYNRIIRYLENMKITRKKYVADLGCGKARVAENFQNDHRFRFYNFDHYAYEEIIKSCDISDVPLEDHTVNIAILCLSMWGSNCKEYIYEAYRILEDHGVLLIIEPTKRWIAEDGSNRLEIMLKTAGFSIKPHNKDKFLFLECTK